MSVYRLCRDRSWTRLEPGRVDRMVRRWRPTHRTVSLEDAVDAWFGFQPGDTITFEVRESMAVGQGDPLAGWLPATTEGGQLAEAVLRHSMEEELERRASENPGPPPDGWFARAARALLDRKPPPSNTLAPQRYVSSYWTFDPSTTPGLLRYLRATLPHRSYPDRPFAVVYPQGPAIGESFRIGWPPWQGYAWPPAGDERRPPQWPGGDHNKSDNKDNRSKDMGTTNGVGGAQDLAAAVARANDEVQAALEAEERRLREQQATDSVHDLAARFLNGIRAAEDLGLEVRVEQTYARQGNNEWRRVPAKTERLRVGVTKQVG